MMDEPQRRQISVEECGEFCDRLFEALPGVKDKEFLWTELWNRLNDLLGYEDTAIVGLYDSKTRDEVIGRIRVAVTDMLKPHHPNPVDCLKVFDARINERGGFTEV
jgi:hypothetical protein